MISWWIGGWESEKGEPAVMTYEEPPQYSLYLSDQPWLASLSPQVCFLFTIAVLFLTSPVLVQNFILSETSMTKTSLLLLGIFAIFALLAVAGFTFLSREQPMPTEEQGGAVVEEPQETTLKAQSEAIKDVKSGDYILLESTGTDTAILSIDGDGRIEFIHFAGEKILEYKKGNISQEGIKQLFNFVEEKGFFEMRELYSGKPDYQQGIPIPPTDPYTTSISIAVQGKSHTVAVTNTAKDSPMEFFQITKELMKVKDVSTLENQPAGIYVKARKMRPKDLEVLRLNGVKINEFTEKQLTSLSVLQKAILGPGAFIYTNQDQEERILQYEIKAGFKHDHFFIKYVNQYYDIFVLEKPTAR